jgi:pimeloyl-ACP methyl ester carboxylesterase
MANSMRTQGVDQRLMRSDAGVRVADGSTTLDLLPVQSEEDTALIFLCGAGVAAEAYVPLLRPIAAEGYRVFIVKLPYRFAPLEAHKRAAMQRTLDVMADHEIAHWALSGHSLGGALACRIAQSHPQKFSALVLLGTTHPKTDDLSFLTMPVTKIHGTHDGVAPPEWARANRHLLPAHTQWVEIQGGNHSQFGHYGHQLFDGRPTISREAQQDATRAVILDVLQEAKGLSAQRAMVDQ